MVNNFCETIIRAVRCNMDIKFIGSGASAKAILYYITDYVTKTQLKTHVAYGALRAAVKKLHEQSTTQDPIALQAKHILIKCANSLISKQELSAQQVAFYVLGNEDKYTSHRFRSIYWTSFERYLDQKDPLRPPNEQIPILDTDTEAPESYHLEHTEDAFQEQIIDGDDIVLSNETNGKIVGHASQLMDYISRNDSSTFNDLCVWDFVASVDKELIPKKKPEADTTSWGRVPNPRSQLSLIHPQHKTHQLRLQDIEHRLVLVPIGPSLPR
jgi:hypothetical protein